MTEEQLRQIAEILWQRIKEDPEKFRGTPGAPGKPGEDGKRGPKGDKGDSIEGLIVEFLDVNDDVVPELTQSVTPDNPVITVPAAKINLAVPNEPKKNITVGAPLGRPIILQQSSYE